LPHFFKESELPYHVGERRELRIGFINYAVLFKEIYINPRVHISLPAIEDVQTPLKSVVSPVTGRRPDIDLLRVIVVLMLVPFHAACAFDPYGSIQIQKQSPINGCIVFVDFVSHFGMPLLFMFAGMNLWFALQKHTGDEVSAERAKRLGIPLLFGCVVLIPPMVYLCQVEVLPSPPSIWAFYAWFFTHFGLTTYDGGWTPGVLWFIFYLWLFSAICIPVIDHANKKARVEKKEGIKHRHELPFPVRCILYLLVPGVIATAAIPLPILSWGAQNMVYYGIYFVIGILMARYPPAQDVIDSLGFPCLVLGVATYLLEKFAFPATMGSWSLAWVLSLMNYGFGSWFWVLAFLGLGHRYIRTGGRVLTYLAEASYPFYVLHATVLGVVAFFIIKLPVAPVPM